MFSEEGGVGTTSSSRRRSRSSRGLFWGAVAFLPRAEDVRARVFARAAFGAWGAERRFAPFFAAVLADARRLGRLAERRPAELARPDFFGVVRRRGVRLAISFSFRQP
jgi:hypothetical protein